MKREPGHPTRTSVKGQATRRQFLSTVVVGAAAAACGDKPSGSVEPPGVDAGPSGGSGGSSTGGAPGAGSGTGGAPGTGGSMAGVPDADQPADVGLQPDAEARLDAVQPSDARPGESVAARKRASDQVTLGRTGIRVSRLAMGSGTNGSGGTSRQTRLGVDAFARLLVQSYREQGLNFWETADSYGAHPHLKEAIRQVGRDKVVIMTKTQATTASQMQADLDRFRRELGIEQIDIVLLHAVTNGTWTQQMAGAMDTLEAAKQRGTIRAHGISCHSLEALRLAARTPWVDVDLARINPARIEMDADPATVIGVLRQMKAAGKGVIGMKILGIGQLANQMPTAIGHAVKLDSIDAFTIGFTSYPQLQQVTTSIEQVPV